MTRLYKRKVLGLPPRTMSALLFRLMPKRTRRYDYGYIVDDYRDLLSVGYKNTRKANIWLAGVIAEEAWRFLPDVIRQLLIALAITAMIST